MKLEGKKLNLGGEKLNLGGKKLKLGASELNLGGSELRHGGSELKIRWCNPQPALSGVAMLYRNRRNDLPAAGLPFN